MSEADTEIRTYTIRLELVDEPGELLRALKPISNRGGNLLSIFHERGNITPRGHIPVEIDLEAKPDQFDTIVDSLRSAGVNVIRAGSEQYRGELNVVLVGHLLDTDLSDTLKQIQNSSGASVSETSLLTPSEPDGISSAQLRIATKEGSAEQVLTAVREIAEQKGLRVVQPTTEGIQ